MQSTKLDKKFQNNLHHILQQYPLMNTIVQVVHQAGGRALLVGGAVRDLLLGLPIKDLDIEVHQLPLEQLEQILNRYGPVSLVGKAYGVLRLHGLDVDWSVPRTEGAGRKPQVVVDPALHIGQAFRRRDLTMNAMGIDLITHELIDPFNGFQDLQKGVLRACDKDRFVEDPLRFYRVMQFIGRFHMMPDDQLNNICAHMDIKKVSVERIEEEFKKLLLKSKKPSLAFEWLRTIGRLAEILPELSALMHVQQNKQWHPEGDVFEHTMQTIDAAAQLEYADSHEKLLIIYAALCHDLGKAVSTEEIEGTLKSFGHAQSGIRLTKRLLKRIMRNKELVDSVCVLVRHHIMPGQLVQAGAKISAYKRLAHRLAPLTMQQLALLALADKRGRNPKKGAPLENAREEIDQFLEMARQAEVLTQIEQPILHGRDLLDVMEPGPAMGRLLKKAYQIQIEEGMRDKEELKRRVLKD